MRTKMNETCNSHQMEHHMGISCHVRLSKLLKVLNQESLILSVALALILLRLYLKVCRNSPNYLIVKLEVTSLFANWEQFVPCFFLGFKTFFQQRFSNVTIFRHKLILAQHVSDVTFFWSHIPTNKKSFLILLPTRHFSDKTNIEDFFIENQVFHKLTLCDRFPKYSKIGNWLYSAAMLSNLI